MGELIKGPRSHFAALFGVGKELRRAGAGTFSVENFGARLSALVMRRRAPFTAGGRDAAGRRISLSVLTEKFLSRRVIGRTLMEHNRSREGEP